MQRALKFISFRKARYFQGGILREEYSAQNCFIAIVECIGFGISKCSTSI